MYILHNLRSPDLGRAESLLRENRIRAPDLKPFCDGFLNQFLNLFSGRFGGAAGILPCQRKKQKLFSKIVNTYMMDIQLIRLKQHIVSDACLKNKACEKTRKEIILADACYTISHMI